MAKSKKTRAPHRPQPDSGTSEETLRTTSQISSDKHVGFMLRVLLHDLQNVGKNPLSEKRLNRTTDEHYLSPPYFTPEETASIKRALADKHTQNSEAAEYKSTALTSVNDALTDMLGGFFDKQRASGDSRPCGPHDLVLIYCSLFGVKLDELQDETFLTRLRRQQI